MNNSSEALISTPRPSKSFASNLPDTRTRRDLPTPRTKVMIVRSPNAHSAGRRGAPSIYKVVSCNLGQRLGWQIADLGLSLTGLSKAISYAKRIFCRPVTTQELHFPPSRKALSGKRASGIRQVKAQGSALSTAVSRPLPHMPPLPRTRSCCRRTTALTQHQYVWTQTSSASANIARIRYIRTPKHRKSWDGPRVRLSTTVP